MAGTKTKCLLVGHVHQRRFNSTPIGGFTLQHGGHVGAHLQKNFNELLLLCAPTWLSWPLSFESYRTEGHVSENHLYTVIFDKNEEHIANTVVRKLASHFLPPKIKLIF